MDYFFQRQLARMTPFLKQQLSTHFPSQQCLRCCEIYSGIHWCKAVTRICYSCRQYGHISRSTLCQRKLVQQEETCDQQHDIIKKSNSQEHVYNPEMVCEIMPFSTVPDDEFADTFQTSHLQNELCYVTQICKKQQVLIATLQASENELKEGISTKEEENKINLAALNVCRQETDSLHQTVNNLFQFVSDFDRMWFEKHMDTNTILQENKHLLQYVCSATQQGKLSVKRDSKCNRCGLKLYHTLKDCAARGNQCGRCYKENHFTFLCKNPVEEHNIEVHQETKQLLDRLCILKDCAQSDQGLYLFRTDHYKIA